MSDTMTREAKRSALDEFANSIPTDNAQALAPSPSPVLAAHQVSGAQALAVHRDERVVLAKIRTLAAAAGGDWYYRFPVRNRKENRTDWIEGPSIKMANDIARLYGNCEVDCRAQDLGSTILFYARFVDLETGFALTRPFQQRKGAAKLGGADDERRADITFQIGASKAIRNVVVNALQTFADFAFDEAKEALVEKIGKNLDRWRANTIDNIKVDVKRVEAVIGRPAAEWLAPDVARVRAMGKAIEDGMASWDETFPPLDRADDDVGAAPARALDDFADERSMVNETGTATASAGAGADADEEPPSSTTASADPRPEIIDKLFKLSAERGTRQDKLEVLDVTATMLGDLYPGMEFVKTAVATVKAVIEGKQPPMQARQYLEGLLK